jgi:DNA-binding Lrp family transcriptional regulator
MIKMLDKKDLKIIKILKDNSRQSVKEIAKTASLRPSTVHLRIQKLIENDIIERFTIQTDDKICSENFIVFILVNSDKEIPNEVFENDNIKEVFGITGEYDILLKCKFSGIEEFNKFILTFRKTSHIMKTVTMVGTTKIKEIV